MEVKITKYAITTKRTDLKLHRGLLNGMILDEKEKISIDAGTMIKVLSRSNTRYYTVQVLDYINHNPVWENIYDCPNSNLKKIHEDMLPFAIPITDPQRRLQFLLNGEQCKYILYLKVNDFVSASGELFGKNSKRYDCIVRYIGLVQELGPGYYFGLELLHLESGYSPQAEDIPFVNIYTSCEPGLALIITADWISQLPSEVKKKFSARELLCGTFEKAKTAIGFNNNSNGNSSSSGGGSGGKHSLTLHRSESVRQNKKSLKELSSDPQLYLKSQPDKAVASKSSHGEETGNEMDQLDFAMDCNNLGINSNHTRITFDNEDYKECVKNYEKLLEQRQHENSITPPPPPPPSTPVVAILKTAKQRRLANVGDNLNTLNTSSVNNKFTGNTMSLDDRDIIVIDKADIKESTKNEANVFVVEKSRQSNEVDLADLLGGNWPNNAGDATFVLNKQADQQPAAGSSAAGQGLQGSAAAGSNYVSSSSNSSVSSFNLQKSDRNKTSASNPLSHMARTVDRNRNRDHQWTQTCSTDSHATSENNIGGRSKEKKFKNTIEQPPLYDNVNSDVNVAGVAAVTLASPEKEFIQASPLPDVPGTSLGVGSMVEVSTDAADDLYGVIRWIGSPLGHKSVYVGVELEDDIDDKRLPTTDGSFNGIRLFKCQEGRGVFIQPSQCSKDRRFVDIDTTPGSKMSSKQPLDSKMFGHMECPPVHEDIPPLKILSLDELEEVCGKFKGIQGHHNSCYLDATLFSMFTFTSVFDSLLFRPPEPEDIPHYLEVQTVLREEIVNPLRKNVFVRADRVMKLRQLLDKLSSVSGLTSEEKDPEEFLNSLLAQIMRAEPFLKLSSGQDAFYYQLFVEKDERLSFPSVQQLFEQSFLSSDIKLKEVPSCLIIQMPRFGKNFKMYPRILPSQVLDVTDIIEDSPRQCSVCGKLAEYECRECFGILQCGVGLESTAFCRKCLETVHSHVKRANHQAKEISVPQDFKSMAEHLTVPRLFMELFAVVCIETSHYVAFVKAGSGLDAPWCFFDSMADRKGEQNGYNIPEMISVPDLPQWLSEDGARTVNESSSNDKMLPEHAKRLFCDAYMCMYQSTDVMMYR